jgi:hypothetical protein
VGRKRRTKGSEVRELIAVLTGRAVDDDSYVGKKVYGRAGTSFSREAGEVTNTSICALDGCGGTRLHVRWPDGKRTYPCVKGCLVTEDGNLRIR